MRQHKGSLTLSHSLFTYSPQNVCVSVNLCVQPNKRDNEAFIEIVLYCSANRTFEWASA